MNSAMVAMPAGEAGVVVAAVAVVPAVVVVMSGAVGVGAAGPQTGPL